MLNLRLCADPPGFFVSLRGGIGLFTRHMRNGFFLLILLGFWLGLASPGRAAEFKLKNGEVLVGEPSRMDSKGMVIRYVPPVEGKGPFSDRIPWGELSQDTLRELAKNPKARPFVQLLILPTPEEMQAQLEVQFPETRKAEIVIGEKPSPGRPHAGTSLLGALFTGGGLIVLLLLYAANLYAAYEIGAFRNYPGFMTAGIAAFAPVITPIVFLCLPRRERRAAVEEEEVEEEVDEAAAEEQAAAEAALAAAAAAAAPVVEAKPIPPTKYFKRGEFNINRRFIETKFASFFRAIPNEEDRDLNLVIKSARGEFTGRRILKITNTDLTFQVPKADNATVDEVIPLNDILEIQIRHKDATD